MSLQIFTIHRPFICIAMRKQRNINNVNDLQPRTQQWAITSELPKWYVKGKISTALIWSIEPP